MPSRKTFCQIRHRVILLAGAKFTYKVGPKKTHKIHKMGFFDPREPHWFSAAYRGYFIPFITGPRAHLAKKNHCTSPNLLSHKKWYILTWIGPPSRNKSPPGILQFFGSGIPMPYMYLYLSLLLGRWVRFKIQHSQFMFFPSLLRHRFCWPGISLHAFQPKVSLTNPPANSATKSPSDQQIKHPQWATWVWEFQNSRWATFTTSCPQLTWKIVLIGKNGDPKRMAYV